MRVLELLGVGRLMRAGGASLGPGRLGILVLLFLCFAGGPAYGGEKSRTITLEEAVAVALKNSPLLRAGASSVEAQVQLVKAAQALYWPTMDFEAGCTRLSDPVAVVPIKGFGPNQRPPFFSKNIY